MGKYQAVKTARHIPLPFVICLLEQMTTVYHMLLGQYTLRETVFLHPLLVIR